ncbi:MAG: hypothetical protein K0R88_1961 [Solirubrobacterales bacterium]|nr:hypothetical protein [Solirubrobacterales bacterium]
MRIADLLSGIVGAAGAGLVPDWYPPTEILDSRIPRVSRGSVERRLPESNRRKRLCRPLRNHSAKAPRGKRSGVQAAR